MKKHFHSLALLLLLLITGFCCTSKPAPAPDAYISYEADLQQQDLQLYWKDERNNLFRSIGQLKAILASKGKTLHFAMNAGMYKADNSPQGLFIQQGNVITPLDTTSGDGNFYLKPNGVFYTTKDKKAVVSTTAAFKHSQAVLYATQSGPMLVMDGNIHPAFKKGSANLHIRNGVGILPNGNPLFVMSKEKISLYDFATYFKKAGCHNALYLDGFVSRAYVPEKNWVQTDGDFGVIIGVTGKE